MTLMHKLISYVLSIALLACFASAQYESYHYGSYYGRNYVGYYPSGYSGGSMSYPMGMNMQMVMFDPMGNDAGASVGSRK